MTKDELNNLYFNWMCQLVYTNRYSKNLSYKKLLYRLHDTNFTYVMPMDDNRAEDGIELRYRFAHENGYDHPMIATYLDNRPCSVLEMMVALSLRCEENITSDPDYGDRTGQWFWNMVVSLGLVSMNDNKFNRDYVDKTIQRFLNREYEPNGKGGLFVIENCACDLRNVEIWYQLCWYLDKEL